MPSPHTWVYCGALLTQWTSRHSALPTAFAIPDVEIPSCRAASARENGGPGRLFDVGVNPPSSTPARRLLFLSPFPPPSPHRVD
jgi:hypothetical protein